MKPLSLWLSGVLTLSAVLSAACGMAWWAMVHAFLAALNFYIGTRE